MTSDVSDGLDTTRRLEALLEPRSVAVIGAGTRPGSIGHEVLRNILGGGYTGATYVVNPKYDSILGVTCVASPELLPEPVDLAVVAVPAAHVPDVVRGCGARGVRALILLSSGFSELGQDGRALQAEVLGLTRKHGIRLVGPNCLGVLNTDPRVRLNATFAELPMRDGGLGLVSQSGALGIAVAAAAARCGLGVAQFVSVGNKADVSGNDLLIAWEHDPRIRVIALYLESFGNPRRFARIARRVSRRTPILAIKAGRSPAGRRAGQSHTAAAATSDDVVEALFRQAGVVRVDTIEQMLDAARVLSDQPLPAGPRVAIVGNSGGPGILAADAATGSGLDVVTLSPDTERRLHVALPSAASWRNPVDLGAAAGPDQVQAAVATLLAAPEVDAVLTVYTDTAVNDTDAVLERIAVAGAESSKPVVATRVGAAAASLSESEPNRNLPVFSFPEPAAAALATAVRYTRIRQAAPTTDVRPEGIDWLAARGLVDAVQARGGGWLTAQESAELFGYYGITLSPQRIVDNPDDAVWAAHELGYPLAVKLATPGAHKSELGGVRLDVPDEPALRRVVAELTGPSGEPLLLQPMAPAGTEVIVGAMQHAQFGPVVMLGAGGVLADLLDDRAFRLAPLSAAEAGAMIGQLRLARLLDGYRGRPVVSRALLADVVARVGTLADDLPEVTELDLNPLICGPGGIVAVDARVAIATAAPPAGQR